MSLPAMKNDRMAVFSHLLVALAGDCRSGDQNAKLTVSQPRDQARNFANAYGIRLDPTDPLASST